MRSNGQGETANRQEIRGRAEPEIDIIATLECRHFGAADGPDGSRASLDLETHELLSDVSAKDAAPCHPSRIAADLVLDATRSPGRDEDGDALEPPSVGIGNDRRDLVPWQIEATPEDRLALPHTRYQMPGISR